MIRCDETLAKRINNGNLKIKMENGYEMYMKLLIKWECHPKHQKSGHKWFDVKEITLPSAASALTWCHSLTPNGAFPRPNNQIIYN